MGIFLFVIIIALFFFAIRYFSSNEEGQNNNVNYYSNYSSYDKEEYNGDYYGTRNKISDSLSKGVLPDVNVEVEGLPIFLDKNEKVVWTSNYVKMYKMKTRTHYEGGSNGFSFRICKGVTYRTSSIKGNPVSEESVELISSGSIVITNNNLYFVSFENTLRFDYNKLLSVMKSDDNKCFLIQEKDGRKKPIIFESKDYNFLYNTILGLIKIYNK